MAVVVTHLAKRPPVDQRLLALQAGPGLTLERLDGHGMELDAVDGLPRGLTARDQLDAV